MVRQRPAKSSSGVTTGESSILSPSAGRVLEWQEAWLEARGRRQSRGFDSHPFRPMEGAARWSATGFETRGRVTARGSTPPPSAINQKSPKSVVVARRIAYAKAGVRSPLRAPSDLASEALLAMCLASNQENRVRFSAGAPIW